MKTRKAILLGVLAGSFAVALLALLGGVLCGPPSGGHESVPKLRDHITLGAISSNPRFCLCGGFLDCACTQSIRMDAETASQTLLPLVSFRQEALSRCLSSTLTSSSLCSATTTVARSLRYDNSRA